MDLEKIKLLSESRIETENQIEALQAALKILTGKILAEIPTEEEGTNTIQAGKFKITTKTPINRKIDPAIWEQVEPELPEALRNVITVKHKDELSLNLKMYRALEHVAPENFSLVSKCVTAKPGTVGLKIVEIEL